VTAAPEVPTINCGRCGATLAEVIAPMSFRDLAGVVWRFRRYAEAVCPSCGYTNGWHGKPAVQDVHHVVERREGQA
jgi:predicted nucleic-acid-binding Zn-ribbon protein